MQHRPTIVKKDPRCIERWYFESLILHLKINNSKIKTKTKILSIAHGQISIEFDHVEQNLNAGDTVSVYTEESFLRISGEWLVENISKERKVLSLKRKDFVYISSYDGLVDPLIFLNSSNYSLFNYKKNTSEYEKAFTSFKDYSDIIALTLEGEKFYKSSFDFSNNAKSLDRVYIKLPSEYTIEKELVIKFSLFSYMFVMKMQILEVNKDYNVIIAKAPENILTFSSRVFWRERISQQCEFRIDSNRSLKGCMSVLSIVGGEIDFDKGAIDNYNKNDRLNINLDSIQLKGHLSHIENNRLYFYLDRDVNNLLQARELIIKNAPHDLVIRNERNYDQFKKLFELTGYSNKDDKNWQLQTYTCWKEQDEKLPQNTIGSIHENELVMTTGTIPFSGNTLYVHSIGMTKNLKSIQSLFYGIILGLDYAWMYPEFTQYTGAFKKKSRFTTNLYTSYEHIGKPWDSSLINTITINCSELNDIKEDGAAKFELAESAQSTTFCTFERYFSNSNPFFDNALIKELLLVFNGEVIGKVFDFRSPRYFTGNDVLNYKWVLLKESCDKVDLIKQIISFLRKHYADTENAHLSLFKESGKVFESITCDKVYQDSFWVFINILDSAPLVSSVARSCYRVIRKYGVEHLNLCNY